MFELQNKIRELTSDSLTCLKLMRTANKEDKAVLQERIERNNKISKELDELIEQN